MEVLNSVFIFSNHLIYKLVNEGITIFVTTHYMDEAEYCQKIGIMRTGKLLAMDAPHTLRGEKFAGLAWNIHIKDTLGALNVLEITPGVQRVGLAADNIRAITDRNINKNQLRKALEDKGFQEIMIEVSDPNLEDVFLSLAKQ